MRILPLLAAVLCFLALTNESLVAPLTQSPFLNIWKPMSAEEIRQTTCWLFSQPDLNLSRATSHGSWHNSMYVLRQPSKWRRLGYSERLFLLCVESQSSFFAPTRQALSHTCLDWVHNDLRPDMHTSFLASEPRLSHTIMIYWYDQCQSLYLHPFSR